MATPAKKPRLSLGVLSPSRGSPRIAAAQARRELLVKEAQQITDQQQAAETLIAFSKPPPIPEDDLQLTEEEKPKYRSVLASLQKEVVALERSQIAETTEQSIGELFKLKAQGLAIATFGVERIAVWKIKFGEVRKIWEEFDPDPQCQNTIGSAEGKECWICGMAVDPVQHHPTKAERETGITTNPFAPECEHILPIAQAALFLDLYRATPNKEEKLAARKTKKPAPILPIPDNVYRLEYDWSHSLCNQTKNDDVYLEDILASAKGPMQDLPVIDDKGYRSGLLREILNTKRDRGDEFKKALLADIAEKYNGNVNKWYQARSDIFVEKYKNIFSFLGETNRLKSPQLYMLALASCSLELANRIRDPRRRNVLGLPPRAGGRRTRRRRHQSIKMSSRRHSLSGKPARR